MQIQVQVDAATVGDRRPVVEPLDAHVVHKPRVDDKPIHQIAGAVGNVDAVVTAAAGAANALPAACMTGVEFSNWADARLQGKFVDG